MAEFSSPYWNWLIVGVTIGGIFALYLLTYRLSTQPEDSGAQTHVWDEDLTELHNPLPRWWVGMFYFTLAFAVIYLLLYPGLGSQPMFLGWSQTGQYQAEMEAAQRKYGPLFERYASVPVGRLAGDPQARAMGERLFAAYCTACHGSDARGVPGFPSLRDADSLYGSEPEAIEASILDGRQGAMPAWGPVLGSDAAVQEVTQYVLSLGGRASDAAKSRAGAARYAELCVPCHGKRGKGNHQVGAPNLTDSTWLYGGAASTVHRSIAEGRSGRMPAHRKRLGEAKVHLLAAYVYSLSHRAATPARPRSADR